MCAHPVSLVGISAIKAGVERISVCFAGGGNDLGCVVMLNAEHGISVFGGALGVLNEALYKCLVSRTNGAVNEIGNVIATAVRVCDNLGEHVCVCIELNVASRTVNARYRVKLYTVCIEFHARIGDVEADRGLFAEVERHCSYGRYGIGHTARLGLARVIADNGFYKS